MSGSLALRSALCVLGGFVMVCASQAASPPASTGTVPASLQELTQEERAVWNSSIGHFCHAYVRTDEAGYERVPDDALEYIRLAIRWQQNNITVTLPKEIEALESRIADKRSHIHPGGTFALTHRERQAQEKLKQDIGALERKLKETRVLLQRCQVAFSQGDLVALESLAPPVLRRFAVGEVGGLEDKFTVRLIHDEKTALAEISPGKSVTKPDGEKQEDVFWVSLEGWPTGHLVTDREYTLDKNDRIGVVRGTRGFETAESGMRTALVIQRVVPGPYLAGITPAQFVEVLQSKGLTPRQFVQLVYPISVEKPNSYVAEVLRRLDELPAKGEPQSAGATAK